MTVKRETCHTSGIVIKTVGVALFPAVSKKLSLKVNIAQRSIRSKGSNEDSDLR